MMHQLVQEFPRQLEEALQIGRSFSFSSDLAKPASVVLTGLGGSGIGGTIVQNYVSDKLAVPFLVNKDYFLPRFVGKDTLVIVSSYSGNTEETLQAMQQALDAGAMVVAITSGGKVAEIAGQNDLDCVMLPAGNPPRASLGYSLTQVLFVLKGYGLLDAPFEQEIEDAIRLLQSAGEGIKEEAKRLAEAIVGKMPVVYASAQLEGLAIRVRQQLNENSKLLSWHGAIPEMNHNELVGWRDDADNIAVLLLRSDDDYERVQTRIEINKGVFSKHTSHIHEIRAVGDSYFTRLFYIVHLTDWLSVFLADLRGVDATEVKVIDFLKGELAKQ